MRPFNNFKQILCKMFQMNKYIKKSVKGFPVNSFHKLKEYHKKILSPMIFSYIYTYSSR